MANTTTISHPAIGNVTASTAKDGVVQVLGVQYATLKDRFSPPVLKEYSSSQNVDGTKLGPQVLSIAPNADPEFGLIQQSLDYDRSAFTQSDTEGLCLNVTIPAGSNGSVDENANLPVFVFIHGGGLNVGSGMYPQYDMARFVQLSLQEGKPCVAVSLNYRLGAPGFLTSSDMRAAGYKPNNGLRDQRTALLWLHKHLPGFGGDVSNITLMGQSAGGLSVNYHLFSKEPLFKRTIAVGGTMLLMPPIPAAEADENFASTIKSLGLAGDTAVKHLLEMDGQELTGKMMQAGAKCVPVLDDDICPTEFNFASIENDKTPIPGHEWCEAALLGDCQFDGNIQFLRLVHRKKGIASAFCSSLTSSLSSHPGLSDRLLSAYDLHPDLDDDEAFIKVLEVANDLNFYVPTLSLSQNLAKHMKTYMYRFNEPNPWEGQWKGHASHILDLAFLLQNFNEYLGEEQKGTAVRFAKDVVAFLHRESPWEGSGKAKVLGPQGKMEVVEDVPGQVGRRSIMLDLGKDVGLDVLDDAFNGFMHAPPAV
ncbi:uncharacterized protein LTR77_001162 [Saxophila tyrrhenica]|uniref:Carboxylic ester hydrolase n=1 Tax=Saxophila tyrrhenica TaxID=1690608 RepID=A0AAV9PP46_9PEZI|nr:hypothetical protein LTR77_001162 [Saxophila tyrrhenica]